MKLSIWWTIGIAAVVGAIGWFASQKYNKAKWAAKVKTAANGADASAMILGG